jgi:hypothetical protein
MDITIAHFYLFRYEFFLMLAAMDRYFYRFELFIKFIGATCLLKTGFNLAVHIDSIREYDS